MWCVSLKGRPFRTKYSAISVASISGTRICLSLCSTGVMVLTTPVLWKKEKIYEIKVTIIGDNDENIWILNLFNKQTISDENKNKRTISGVICFSCYATFLVHWKYYAIMLDLLFMLKAEKISSKKRDEPSIIKRQSFTVETVSNKGSLSSWRS